MATIDELQAQIASAQRSFEEKKKLLVHEKGEFEKALERQRLRKELQEVQRNNSLGDSLRRHMQQRRAEIDRDETPPVSLTMLTKAVEALGRLDGDLSCSFSQSEVVNCTDCVHKKEHAWKIEGISWLRDALRQNDEKYVESESLVVIGGDVFSLRYNPSGGKIGKRPAPDGRQNGTLALVHMNTNEKGVTFRYRILIKNKQGAFVQWGETGEECYPGKNTKGWAFGPDVTTGASRSGGIFDLGYEELLQSEWVVDDILTVKFEIELRVARALDVTTEEPDMHVEVPGATFASDLLALLNNGKCSDVTINVQGEMLKAHASILCARSEVFDRMLNGGMQEAASKEIKVEDGDATSFKVLLNFLYTDDLDSVKEMVTTHGASGEPGARIALLQTILGLCHKYQVSRLRVWCELQLCRHITGDGVCGLLRQAHLYEAKQLEKACLRYIRDNKDQVMVTSAFRSLSKQWPEVMLKISMFIAGVTPSSVASSDSEAQPSASGKRKREEE